MSMWTKVAVIVAVATFVGGAAFAPIADYTGAARGLDAAIERAYAYPDKLPGGVLPQSPRLTAERDAVTDRDGLVRYAEDRLASLADHHANTGSNLADSWALVPTYADLWIVTQGDAYVVDAVRERSPAAAAGVTRGERLVGIDDIATAAAVASFWRHLGLDVTPRRAVYAARVLAAGRRDRERHLTIMTRDGALRHLTLPSLYRDDPIRASLAVSFSSGRTVIRINNSLGDNDTIAAFDAAMMQAPAADDVVLDLRDTPAGGNTTVARAIMGWFVDRARGYQIHQRPQEERETGIPHQWVEQVLPRPGKHHGRLPLVLVGRWTGSMGEGLAIGFAALGASIRGGPMAGLNGAVEDISLGDSGLTIALPTERLMTISGQPREDFGGTVDSRDGCSASASRPHVPAKDQHRDSCRRHARIGWQSPAPTY